MTLGFRVSWQDLQNALPDELTQNALIKEEPMQDIWRRFRTHAILRIASDLGNAGLGGLTLSVASA